METDVQTVFIAFCLSHVETQRLSIVQNFLRIAISECAFVMKIAETALKQHRMSDYERNLVFAGENRLFALAYGVMVVYYAETHWIRRSWLKRINTPLDRLVADPFIQSFMPWIPISMTTAALLPAMFWSLRYSPFHTPVVVAVTVPLNLLARRYMLQSQDSLNMRIRRYHRNLPAAEA